jgi:hypothetical protein
VVRSSVNVYCRKEKELQKIGINKLRYIVCLWIAISKTKAGGENKNTTTTATPMLLNNSITCFGSTPIYTTKVESVRKVQQCYKLYKETKQDTNCHRSFMSKSVPIHQYNIAQSHLIVTVQTCTQKRKYVCEKREKGISIIYIIKAAKRKTKNG